MLNVLTGKVVAVTGGSGFLGCYLMEEIQKEKPLKLKNISRKTGYDATDYEQMLDALRGVDVVFDVATLSLPLSLQAPHSVSRQIYMMALNMAELCRIGVVKTLIHVSSSEVYGSAISVAPMDEKHPFNPTTPYAGAKAAADMLLRSYITCYGIDCAIVRPFNFYGAYQPVEYGGIIPTVINKILKGDKIVLNGDGTQSRDFSYVKDIAKGIIKVYKESKTRGKEINLASGESTQIKDLVNLITTIMDYKKPIEYKGTRLGEVQTHKADTSLAKSLIKYKPETTLYDGLAETVAWYSSCTC